MKTFGINILRSLAISHIIAGCALTDESAKWREESLHWRGEFIKLRDTLPKVADSIDPLAIKDIFRSYKEIADINRRLEQSLSDALNRRQSGYSATLKVMCWHDSGHGRISFHLRRIGPKRETQTYTIVSLACAKDKSHPTDETVAIPAKLIGPGDYEIVADPEMEKPKPDWELKYSVDVIDPVTNAKSNVCIYNAYEQGWTPNEPRPTDCKFHLNYTEPQKLVPST